MQHMGAESTEFRWGALLKPCFSTAFRAVYRALPKTEPIHRPIVQPRILVTIEILPQPSKLRLLE